MSPIKTAGLVALTAGFLGGSLAAIVDPDSVAWGAYAGMIALAVAGVAMMRFADRAQASGATVLEGKMRDIRESVALILEATEDLSARHADSEPPPAGKISTYDLPGAIDARFAEPIDRFVTAREAIATVHGSQAYADIMGEFAAGERYLNRVWSASAEGYVDEASTYLERARAQFARTRELIAALPS